MTVGVTRPRVAVWSAGVAIAVVLVATGMRDDTSAIIALIVLPILALAVAALDHLLTIEGSRP